MKRQRRVILDLATGAVTHDPPLAKGEQAVTPWGLFPPPGRDAGDELERKAV